MSGAAYYLYDVFTDEPFSGNPLAVFLDARELSSELMARIANELNLSETVFLTPALVGSAFRLRIFTPKAQLPFAGHPTIGAACALRDAGLAKNNVTFELTAGDVEVSLDDDGARFTAPVAASKIEICLGRADAAKLLCVPDDDVVAIHGADAGVPFACIELRSRIALREGALSLEEWKRSWADSEVPHVYAFSRGRGNHIDARMFAPAMGIQEDPATGGAAAALAALLADGSYTISQGEDMGRLSTIGLSVTGNRATISGAAVKIGTGELTRLFGSSR